MLFEILQRAGLLDHGLFTRKSTREAWRGLTTQFVYGAFALKVWLAYGYSHQIPFSWRPTYGSTLQVVVSEHERLQLRCLYSWVAWFGLSLQLLRVRAQSG